MNCIIVDDDETSRLVLSNLANKINDLNLIKACANTTEAREVMKNVDIDLLLLDIEMPEETGVEFFESINTKTDVIFITSQTKHAVRAFENDAVDYLVKPINLDRLRQAVEKAKRRRTSSAEEVTSMNDKYLFVKNKDLLEKVFYKDIKYIEATSGYVTFYTVNKDIVTNGVLKKIEDKLDKKHFVRVHRSYMVNINKITGYDSDSVKVGKDSIPLSRMYKKEVITILDNLTI